MTQYTAVHTPGLWWRCINATQIHSSKQTPNTVSLLNMPIDAAWTCLGAVSHRLDLTTFCCCCQGYRYTVGCTCEYPKTYSSHFRQPLRCINQAWVSCLPAGTLLRSIPWWSLHVLAESTWALSSQFSTCTLLGLLQPCMDEWFTKNGWMKRSEKSEGHQS